MRKNILLMIISVLIIITVVICILLNIMKNTKNEENTNTQINNVVSKTDSKELKEVKSATEYFTVQSCVNKYLTYIEAQNISSILKILDVEYINNNNITEKNVLNNVGNISEMVIFEAKKMYVEEIDQNNNKYYITGILKRDRMDDENGLKVIKDNFNIAVKLDFENMIFSVIPLKDGGVFNEKNS